MGNGSRLQPDFSSREMVGNQAHLQAHRDNRLWSWTPEMQGTVSDRVRLRPQGILGNVPPTNSDPPSPISPQRLPGQAFLASAIPLTVSVSPLVLLTSPEHLEA